MSNLIFKYDQQEVNIMLKKITILVDTREQKNQHILEYFKGRSIAYEQCKLDAGDYSCYIKKDESLDILRDMYIPISIERKNSIDELAQSFADRNRFENEFIRAEKSGYKISLLIEDAAGYEKIISGNYQSKYNSKAFLGSLKAFEARYNFSTVYMDKSLTGHYLYYSLLYQLREAILSGR